MSTVHRVSTYAFALSCAFAWGCTDDAADDSGDSSTGPGTSGTTMTTSATTDSTTDSSTTDPTTTSTTDTTTTDTTTSTGTGGTGGTDSTGSTGSTGGSTGGVEPGQYVALDLSDLMQPLDMFVDDAGNVYFWGMDDADVVDPITGSTMVGHARKYNPAGVLQWEQDYHYVPTFSVGLGALDSMGNVIGVGFDNNVAPWQGFVNKLGPDGGAALLDFIFPIGGSNTTAYAATTDASNNIIVGGQAGGAFVRQYAATSGDPMVAPTVAWTSVATPVMPFTPSTSMIVRAMVVDDDGIVHVTGNRYDGMGGTFDTFVASFDPAMVNVGAAAQVRYGEFPSSRFEQVKEITWADEGGETMLYVVGVVEDMFQGNGDLDAWVRKVDESGAEVWYDLIEPDGEATPTRQDVLGVTMVDGNAVVIGNTAASLGGTPPGLGDVYLQAYSPASNAPVATEYFGTPMAEELYFVDMNANGDVVGYGFTAGDLDGVTGTLLVTIEPPSM